MSSVIVCQECVRFAINYELTISRKEHTILLLLCNILKEAGVYFKLVSREQRSFNLSAVEVIGSHSKSLLSRWHYILSVMHHALSHYKRHQEFCERLRLAFQLTGACSRSGCNTAINRGCSFKSLEISRISSLPSI